MAWNREQAALLDQYGSCLTGIHGHRIIQGKHEKRIEQRIERRTMRKRAA